MTSYHGTLAVVLAVVKNTIRVVLDVVVWVQVVLAAGCHHLHGRRVVQTYPDRVRLVLGEASTRVVCLSKVEVGCQLQPVEYLIMNVCLDSVTSRLGVNDYTFLIHQVGREISLCFLVTL